MYSGMPRTNECFPVYTVGGRIGPDELMSSSNSTFFSLSLSLFLPLPSISFYLRWRQTNRIQHEYHLVSSTTKHARLLLLPLSWIDLPRGIWFIAVSEMQPTQWRVEQHRCYMLFSTFLRTVWVGRMYKLLSSKISPRYVLRELHLAKKRGRDSGHADFFIPNFLIYLPPSFLPPIHPSSPLPHFLHWPVMLLFHFLLRSSSSQPFLSPFSYIVPNPPSYFHPPPLCSIYPPCTSFSPSPSVLTVPFHLYFRFFHNFASIRYVLTGQWVSGKHLPLVSSSILYHPARRICRGVDTLTSKPGPFLFFHFYAFSPHPRPS